VYLPKDITTNDTAAARRAAGISINLSHGVMSTRRQPGRRESGERRETLAGAMVGATGIEPVTPTMSRCYRGNVALDPVYTINVSKSKKI
jgi:hypothetical protein